MANTAEGLPPDPLKLLRDGIATQSLPIPATSPDPTTQGETNVSLAEASHLIFNTQTPQDGAHHIAVPLTQPTRFVSVAAGDKAVDLRSAYFCWLSKDRTTAEYIAALQTLNTELQAAGKAETASNLVFAEKLDLVTWLAGDLGVDESEYIRSLDDNVATRAEAAEAAQLAAPGDEDVEMGDAGVVGSAAAAAKEAERLREIYAAERSTGDHNTVLRGIKIQDFGGVRKYSALFLGKGASPVPAPSQQQQASRPQQLPASQPHAVPNNPALRRPAKPNPPGKRPDPIILLSPSASSLLGMTNIKAFLADGVYKPSEPGTESSSLLFFTKKLRSIWPGKDTKFVLVEDPSHFRPDYWDRVVAVFTTGQTWQFKNYKWTTPVELFSHVLGVYVGWRGDVVPDTVKGWGRGVLSVAIDRNQRWRDREVMEDIWTQIEAKMRAQGWGKEPR